MRGTVGRNELLCFKSLKVQSLYCFSRCVTREGGNKCIKYLTIKLKPFVIGGFLFSVTDRLLSLFLSISPFLISLATALTFFLAHAHSDCTGTGEEMHGCSHGEFASPRAELQNSAGFRSASQQDGKMRGSE